MLVCYMSKFLLSNPHCRSSMSCTVRLAALSSCVRSAQKGTKTRASSPVATSCASPALLGGRYVYAKTQLIINNKIVSRCFTERSSLLTGSNLEQNLGSNGGGGEGRSASSRPGKEVISCLWLRQQTVADWYTSQLTIILSDFLSWQVILPGA